jgi:hypothetical protein
VIRPSGHGATVQLREWRLSIDPDTGQLILFLFGPEIAFRAQPHGTFKFLFNGIYLGATSNGRGTTTEQ